MIHKARIEIEVDTEKQGTDGWVSFQIKADPKVPAKVQNIHMHNYPAVLIAGKIMQLFTNELADFKQLEMEFEK